MPDEPELKVDEQPSVTAEATDVHPSSAPSDDPNKSPYENLLRREPYDFARCTFTLTLQLMPDDGDPAGRPVMLGVQDHAFAPLIRFARLNELTLPPALMNLLDVHAQSMSEREQAYRAEQEAMTQEAEARQTPRHAAKSKPKTVKATDLPPPTPPTSPPAPVNDKPQQSSLFGLSSQGDQA
ncbi:MAG: hypothetical protein LC737_08770 [Chloroflexi bacterium]|nr:hypothetical protein [Chloroflexota bacterium]